MQPQACYTQLAHLLTDEQALLALLTQQLQREHELLTANDVEGMEQAADARQTSVAKLLRLDDDRRSLCRLLGRSADQTGLGAVLQWCDPTGSLQPAHVEVSRLAQRCREQNDRNGMLVNARLSRVSGMLDMLNGGSAPSGKTYESRGMQRSPSNPHAGRMVSVSA
jgi:flagellar biosynthesis/type III secretory pathway chaperone